MHLFESMFRCTTAAAVFCLMAVGAGAAPPSVDDFLSFSGVDDFALSPDGKYLAAVQDTENSRHIRALVVYRVDGLKITFHKGSKFTNRRAFNLWWASNNRLLVTLQSYDPDTGSPLNYHQGGRRYTWQPPEILSLDANLENSVSLLGKARSFRFNLDRAEILHRLPDDPKRILMALYSGSTLDVYRVNVENGMVARIERGNMYTVGWKVDWDANVRLRIDARNFSTNFSARNSPEDEWFEIARYRRREVPDISPMAFSPDPNILYVFARRDQDRLAIYEYKMRERTLGRLIFSHPKVDVTTGLFTRADHRLVGFRYVVHKPRAEYLEKEYKDFERKLEEAFGKENFAAPITSTLDEKLMVMEVSGPRNPGTFYLFDRETNNAQRIGVRSTALKPDELGTMKPVVYKARDGVEIYAYFTMPPGNPSRPPLVVIPHGGPESRDYLEWDTRAQFLATRGYAILQPNFRGSDGFGKKFVESGFKQWGLKMQDDITDGVRHLISQGLVDPNRICIVGGSYGGYAALAGAAFTPDLYKCAVSINGIGDLYGMMIHERKKGYEFHYWKKSIGDPSDSEDRKRMRARSPMNAVDNITAPILLIAGEADETVSVIQTREMAEALKEAGKSHTYIEFEKEGHLFSAYKNRKRTYLEMEAFLARHIGPKGQGAPAASEQSSTTP